MHRQEQIRFNALMDAAVALPETRIPIVLVGAGDIARTAHLPAYQKAGFTVRAVYDTDAGRAEALAHDFGIERVARSLNEAIDVAGSGAIYDLAIPPAESLQILPELPAGSGVLIQKPMGKHLDQARAIRDVCTRREFKAAVNFQFRFSPVVRAARSLISKGWIGEIYNMEARVIAYSPLLIWSEIDQMERVAILYYAIHYLDAIRSFMGDPDGLVARTVNHRQGLTSAATRSCTILSYGADKMATIVTNHHRVFDPTRQAGYLRWEGDRGLIEAHFQPNAYCPEKGPDTLEWRRVTEDSSSACTKINLPEKWIPDAFIGTMASLMRVVEGSSDELPTSVDDAFKTMSLVEAAYQSNESHSALICR